jgi:carbonic anhydrase
MSKNLCSGGNMQSPIDIVTGKTAKCGALCDLIVYYRTSKCNLTNTGNEIVLDYDSGSYVTYNSVVYELQKITFTIPASHKIDNYSYSMEAQLYHVSPDTADILIVSILLDINDASSKSKMFLDSFSNILPKKSGQQATLNTDDSWSIYHLLPEIKSFYSYKGSLPRSPCSENVQWIVFENASNVSNDFFDKLKAIYPDNARKIQETNGRPVFYNINSNEKNKRNYGDKMRCYSDKEFREQCSKLSRDSELMTAKNKQALLIVGVVSIVVMLVLFILWLVQQDFFNNTLEKVKSLSSQKVFKPKVK